MDAHSARCRGWRTRRAYAETLRARAHADDERPAAKLDMDLFLDGPKTSERSRPARP
jgi:hypothetical protein